MQRITPPPLPAQPAEAERIARRLLDRASGIAVVLSRDVSMVADVGGLGTAWAGGTRFWLDLPDGPHYLILAATSRGNWHNPSALLARDTAALRYAALLVTERTRGSVLWSNLCNDVAWQVICDVVAETTSTEGTA